MRCFRSAFRERSCTPERCRGIFNTSTGPCEGEGSDFFEAGSNATTSYSTCRPQLHADGIGTWLEPVSCEDSDLKPQGGATEQTVYAAVRQIGDIFNVAPVAEALVASIGIGPYTPLYLAGVTSWPVFASFAPPLCAACWILGARAEKTAINVG